MTRGFEETLTQQKTHLFEILFKHSDDGRVSFELYRKLIDQNGDDGAKGRFFIRLFEQCFKKDMPSQTFIFDFHKYKNSNIFKLKELPSRCVTKIAFHFLIRDN